MKQRLSILALIFSIFPLLVVAQQLQLTGLDGKTVTLSTSDLKTLPRQIIVVVNAHNQNKENYEGVLLSDVLAKVNAPAGEKLHGPTLMTYVKAAASDNYQVLFALAEIDQSTHKNQIIVADRLNGKPLDDESGPLKLVAPEDTHPSRSIRMLTKVSLHQAP
jgi:hypothetical protein